MAAPLDNGGETVTSDRTERRRSIGLALGLAAILALILGVAYYTYTTRSVLESRLADLGNNYDTRIAEQTHGLRQDTAAITADVVAVTKRLEDVTQETQATRALARSLGRAQNQAERTLAAQMNDIRAIRQDVATLAMDTTARFANVSTEVKTVTDALDGARREVADGRRQIDARQASAGEQVAGNTKAIAELRRLGEREAYEFDLAKSSEPVDTAVAGVRLRLTDTNVRKGRYNLILHVDDRQIERKDRTIGEPVQFLMGPQGRRYELVATDVGRDRIHGYLIVSSVAATLPGQVAVR